MKASIRFREIYPVALFVTFLTLWGLIGVSNATHNAASPIEWSKFIKSPDVRSTCKDDLYSSFNSLACTDQGDKLFSPWVSHEQEPSRHLSKLERNSKFKSQ